ncbi:uncharacterized protein CTRU02_207274 [Colletotrichum truncatum]|uniref:Uncharacterized protein n=1 Tax=Colletotrichum truncatum TaxID=5467 RepID=A0ACC3Z0B9_COLTU|nr:uncharacterized protein CTRU02_01090 [Colletotrichum truncatum]KAF6800685.1 hypothetical protein CTRU02_01090 [Colletotrichum truncatum]
MIADCGLRHRCSMPSRCLSCLSSNASAKIPCILHSHVRVTLFEGLKTAAFGRDQSLHYVGTASLNFANHSHPIFEST